MGARPIITNFNRLGPCAKILTSAKFHDNCFKIATCTLHTKFTWIASRPDGRRDIVESAEQVILSRTVYLKVGGRIFFLYVTMLRTNALYPLHLW